MISITCTSQHFLFVWQSVGIENTMISASVNGLVISVSIKSDLRNFLVSFDHASFGFVYKLAQVSMFNNKCSL